MATVLANLRAATNESCKAAEVSGAAQLDGPEPKQLADDADVPSPERKGKPKARGRAKTSINLSYCFNLSQNVVRECALKLGWREILDKAVRPDMLWMDANNSHTRERFTTLQKFQRINFFPGMHELCHKRTLAITLKRTKMFYKHEFSFFPATMLLPEDYDELVEQFSSAKRPKTFIVKPDAKAQGDGIFLIRCIADLKVQPNAMGKLIVQRYVHRPFLLDSLKFDFRVYVIITSVDPLRVYVADEGLARFSTRRYCTPTTKNKDERTMHLTNYSITKHDEAFVHSEDGEDGTKRTLSSVLTLLRSLGHDVDELWARIKDMVAKTCVACLPTLWYNYRMMLDPANGASACFQLLGFDVLLDWKLRPWLLEINNSPSLNLDTPVDQLVKGRLIEQILRLMRPLRNAAQLSAEELGAKQLAQEMKHASPGCTLVYPADTAAHADFDRSCVFANPLVRALFAKYAMGPAESVERTRIHGLSQQRFGKLVRDVVGMNTGLSRAEADLLYVQSCKLSSVSKIQERERGMNLEMFSLALLKIALKKFPDSADAKEAFVRLLDATNDLTPAEPLPIIAPRRATALHSSELEALHAATRRATIV